MGGKEARGGFWFQDAKALVRLLADAIERRRRNVLGIDLGPELRVRIESAVEIVVDPPEPAPVEAPRRPVWDGTFTLGDVTVVDECKLGGPTRNDRVTFYRRLRATLAADIPVVRLVPRFTVGRGSIDELDRWTGLGLAAQSATPGVEPPARVDSVQKLAIEAVYYLTTPEPIWTLKKEDDDGKKEVPSTPALTLDDARALLSRFEIDAASTIDDLEAELRRQLEEIGGSLPIDELVDLLGGWIGRIARANSWHDDLTADVLSEKLTLVARYLTLDPASEGLWHRLRSMTPAAPVTMITEQPWRDVQPHVGPIVSDRVGNPRVAFTSEGGIGKSYLLGMLFLEQTGTRVWVDAVAELRGVEAAIALGAWAVGRSGESLTVFVDSIDQVADPAGLLATLHRSLAACDSAVVYVGTRFATWADMRARLASWREVQLTRWNDERIRALAEVGRTGRLSGDLVDLLRTPLLLDLFLRTFAVGDAVPAGLATRHGVLRAYFERRVYAGSTAAARRIVLDAGVDAVLANEPTWRNTDPAAPSLLSEGVVVSTFGALRFRHALLRDFSAALQLVPRSAAEIAAALHDVVSPIVRNELLRGTIEALLDPDPIVDGAPLSQLVAECTRIGLAPGIALGTTDAPTGALLAAIAPLDGGAILRQALAHARLIENRAWLRAPAALGDARPDWLGEAQFQGLASLAELALASGDAASSSLAATMRPWTLGRKIGAMEAWPAATIGALLVRELPDDTTAHWFAGLALGENGFRSRFLEQLRDLGASEKISNAALARALENVVFGEGSHVLGGGHSLWEVTNLCLSDHEGNKGLLATRPYVALSLMFALSVEQQLIEDRRREEITPDPVLIEMLAGRDRPADFVAAEARLRLEPTLSVAEALGELVDDAPTTDRHSFDYLETLIDDVEQRAASDQSFAEQLAEAALASRSAHARIIVLSLDHGGRFAEAIDKILRDPRIYHVLYASAALWDAIQARWALLSIADRSTVQQNILARARSPLLSFTSVGRLASAVPREERDPMLQPYVQFLETTGRSTAPPRPARVEVVSGGLDDGEDDPSSSNPTIARLEELSRIENDEIATNEAIGILEQVVDELGIESSDRTWFAVARVVQQDERRDVRTLTSSFASALFEAALASIEPRRSDPERWSTLIDIADACPSYVPDAEALTMRTRIIEEVVVGAGEQAERDEHAWRALVFVRPIAWFSEGTGGRSVFERWFRDHLHGDGLRAGQRLLQFIPGEARLELVCRVLETVGRLEGPEGHAFIDDAGGMLAGWSLWWEQGFARDRVQRLFDAAERPGALSTAEAWRWFVSGFAWSLQNEIRHIAPDPRAEPGLARFVPLLGLAWSAWRTVIDDAAERNISVGWSVTAPLGHEFAARIDPPTGGWSIALRDLLPRVVQEGGRNDIAAFQQVDWGSVDPGTLVLIANATIARVEREISNRPATDWIINGLIEILVRTGKLPSLALAEARRVLDCLQRLGRSATQANSAALLVEREVRARETSRDR